MGGRETDGGLRERDGRGDGGRERENANSKL